MPDRTQFSAKLLAHPEAANDAALDRVAIAKKRIQSVLDRDTVAHQRTLEQKIAEQGPTPQRVHPHLIGLAVLDLQQLNRMRVHKHTASRKVPWLANVGTSDHVVQKRLDVLAPLYAQVAGGAFGNLTGDALEIIVFKCLQKMFTADRRFAYQGHFFLDRPKNNQGRYERVDPPLAVAGGQTTKPPDFVQYGYSEGPLCIECKNYREWFYPREQNIRELIIKSCELDCIPILVARRLHYTTITNFLQPAGIISHESIYQYYPEDQAELATKVKHARLLGFTDVEPTETPHARTIEFFEKHVPNIIASMAQKWHSNKDQLLAYALGEVNLAQLYNAIGSPAAGNWQEDFATE